MTDKIKVVLVEDNEDERDFMKEGLTASELFEVVAEASNGEELLALFKHTKEQAPPLILCDLNMPGKDGYDVLRDIKDHKAFSRSCVIILSSAPKFPYAERCKKLGACAYFTKPDTFLEYEEFAGLLYKEAMCSGCLKKEG